MSVQFSVRHAVRGGRKDRRCANHELEAAVGRGRSKSGVVTIRGLGVWIRKTGFRCSQVELSTQLYQLYQHRNSDCVTVRSGTINIRWFGYGVNDIGHLDDDDDGWRRLR